MGEFNVPISINKENINFYEQEFLSFTEKKSFNGIELAIEK